MCLSFDSAILMKTVSAIANKPGQNQKNANKYQV